MTAKQTARDCNCDVSRIIAVLLIIGAFVLAVLTGVFVAGLFLVMLFLPHAGPGSQATEATAAAPAAMAGMLQQGMPGGLIGFMLVAIAALLLLILILLAVLLWCCCRCGRKGIPVDLITALLPLLPHVRDIGPAVRAAVTALNASSVALGTIQDAGDRLGEVVNVAGGTVDVWKKGSEIAAMLGFFSIKNETEAKEVSGFGDVATAIDKVRMAGELLKTPPVGISDIRKAKNAVDAAAAALDPIATAMGAPPS